MALFYLSLAVLVLGCAAQEKVNVGFYSEALCPGCDALAEGSMNEAVEKVSEVAMPVHHANLAFV